jgi:large subunit ribosomal protein L6
MSYIGRLPIKIPEEVSILVEKDNKSITVKGPHGELSVAEISGITYNTNPEETMLHVSLEDKKYKRFWGLARTLVSNNIIGVSRQFILKLELIGVGYRVSVQEANPTVLELKLGYSHDILLDIPSDIKVECLGPDKARNQIVLSGKDKDLLSKFAFKIKSFRPPEPYKGKGILYATEKIQLKEGKKK